MLEYGFSLACIFYDSDLIREYTGQRKPVFWHILFTQCCLKGGITILPLPYRYSHTPHKPTIGNDKKNHILTSLCVSVVIFFIWNHRSQELLQFLVWAGTTSVFCVLYIYFWNKNQKTNSETTIFWPVNYTFQKDCVPITVI